MLRSTNTTVPCYAAGIVSGLSWLVYVIAVRSYSGMVTESVLTSITAASLLKKEPKADSVPQKGVDEDG